MNQRLAYCVFLFVVHIADCFPQVRWQLEYPIHFDRNTDFPRPGTLSDYFPRLPHVADAMIPTARPRSTRARSIYAAQSTRFNETTDTLWVGRDNPNEVLRITGTSVINAHIMAVNNGFLIFDSANVSLNGNIVIRDRAALSILNSSWNVNQGFIYQYLLHIYDRGKFAISNSTIRANGTSWGIVSDDSAHVSIESSSVENGFTTWVFLGRASGRFAESDNIGEILPDWINDIRIRHCSSFILWLFAFDGTVIDTTLPPGATVQHFQISESPPRFQNIPYTVVIDTSSAVSWGLIALSGSDVRFTSTAMKLIGFELHLGNDNRVSGLVNNSHYSDLRLTFPATWLRLVNCDVGTWSFYPSGGSRLTIENCIFGEALAQDSATCIINNSLCDGSGGYVGAQRSATMVMNSSLNLSETNARDNSVLIATSSSLLGSKISAAENSTLVLYNTVYLTEPRAHGAGAVLEMFLPPQVWANNTLFPIKGTARVIRTSTSNLRFNAYAVEYERQGSWNAIGGFQPLQVSNGVLARWNTDTMATGIHTLRLRLAYSDAGPFRDTLDLISSCELVQNAAPVISSFSPQTNAILINPNDTVSFHISAYDPEGEPLLFRWMIGGQSISTDSLAIFTSSVVLADSMVVEIRDQYHITRKSWLVTVITDIRDRDQTPISYGLSQNYPNPFNPTTAFQFSLVNSQLTTLKVYDLLGRQVATLLNEVKQPGNHTVRWNAADIASGVYLYRLEAGEFRETKKLLLLK